MYRRVCASMRTYSLTHSRSTGTWLRAFIVRRFSPCLAEEGSPGRRPPSRTAPLSSVRIPASTTPPSPVVPFAGHYLSTSYYRTRAFRASSLGSVDTIERRPAAHLGKLNIFLGRTQGQDIWRARERSCLPLVPAAGSLRRIFQRNFVNEPSSGILSKENRED